MSTDCSSSGSFKGSCCSCCVFFCFFLTFFFLNFLLVPCTFFSGMSDASGDVTAVWNAMWKYCISSRTIR